MTEIKNITQLFSKWRKEWVYFSDSFGNKYTPNESEINEMKKFYYKLR